MFFQRALLTTVFVATFYMLAHWTPAQAQDNVSSYVDTLNAIEIVAEEGVELDESKQTIIAYKNVVLIHLDTTLYADKMTAFYRDKGDGSKEFYKVLGEGNARIVSPSGDVTGPSISFDPLSKIARVIGKSQAFMQPRQ